MRTLALFGLVGILLLSACNPSVAPTEIANDQPTLIMTTAALPTNLPTATLIPATATLASAIESITPTPLAVATSRGPNLEATDPSTVQLASGGIQLVELFRFT